MEMLHTPHLSWTRFYLCLSLLRVVVLNRLAIVAASNIGHRRREGKPQCWRTGDGGGLPPAPLPLQRPGSPFTRGQLAAVRYSATRLLLPLRRRRAHIVWDPCPEPLSERADKALLQNAITEYGQRDMVTSSWCSYSSSFYLSSATYSGMTSPQNLPTLK